MSLLSRLYLILFVIIFTGSKYFDENIKLFFSISFIMLHIDDADAFVRSFTNSKKITSVEENFLFV